MGNLIYMIPGLCHLILSLPGKALRTLVELRGLPGNSTCILEAEPGTLNIKRHSSSVCYIIDVPFFFLVFQSSC